MSLTTLSLISPLLKFEQQLRKEHLTPIRSQANIFKGSLSKAVEEIASASTVTSKVGNTVLVLLPQAGHIAFKLLPFKLQKKALLTGLTYMFSEELEDDELEFLSGKWLKISIKDLALQWYISVENNKFIMASHKNEVLADVTFTANADDLLLIAGRKQDPDTLFFQRRLTIEGDTELGLEIKNLIDAIDLAKLPSSVNKLIEHSASWVDNAKQNQKASINLS